MIQWIYFQFKCKFIVGLRYPIYNYTHSIIEISNSIHQLYQGNIFTYFCQNIKKAYLFKFARAIIHSWFIFIFFSFFKIALSKSIQLSTLFFKEYSICNDIALEALVCLILVKADAKLLEQQIFNNIWQYLSIGASL